MREGVARGTAQYTAWGHAARGADLAECHLGQVAESSVQVMRELHGRPEQLLVHELHLGVEGEGVPVNDAVPDRILHSLGKQGTQRWSRDICMPRNDLQCRLK